VRVVVAGGTPTGRSRTRLNTSGDLELEADLRLDAVSVMDDVRS
jgi:hypothetical protein